MVAHDLVLVAKTVIATVAAVKGGPVIRRWAGAFYRGIPVVQRRAAKMRRARYDTLKALIAERHFQGFAGLIVSAKNYDWTDMGSFGPPMYGAVKNKAGDWCIFWDRKMLTAEIGTGAPLKEGEVISAVDDPKLWQRTPEEVDENKPLTHQKAAVEPGGESL